jgi:hypothetical protein
MKFSPPELEKRVRSAVSTLDQAGAIWIDDADLRFAIDDAGESDPPDEDELTVTEATSAEFEIESFDDRLAVPLAYALGVIEEVHDKKRAFFDGGVFHSQNRTVVRLTPLDATTFNTVEGLMGNIWEVDSPCQMEVDGENVTVGLIACSLHFSLAVVVNDYFFDEANPSIQLGELFVEVRHPPKVTKATALEVAYAYLFELGSSAGLQFAHSARPSESDFGKWLDNPQDELAKRLSLLRPVLIGVGLAPLLRDFQRGTEASDPEISILYYSRCIEYVSATVVREQQYEDLRKRLTSREALSPSAGFMDDLVALIDEQKKLNKDSEALKLTVEKCCDAVLLVPLAPKSLPLLQAVTASAKSAERRNALTELANALSATRNQTAHAKANYVPTGKECPEGLLGEFAVCCRAAAEQCIRWYAAQNPELRRHSA